MFTIKIPRAELIGKISFAIFIFFAFFTTALPFQDTMQDIGAEDLATSNVLNQLLYPTLFFLSFIAFISNLEKVITIIKAEKFLSIFIVYALVTVLWSDFPSVSIKRWFQLFTYYFVILVFLSYIENLEGLLKIIRPILYTYVIVSIFSVFLIPGAKDPLFGTWRGLAATKNNLGQIGVVATVLSLMIYLNEKRQIKKYIAFIILIFSITLAIGTFSSTTYTALFIFLITSLLFTIKNKLFSRVGAGYFLFFSTIIASALIASIVLVFAPEVLDYFQSLFGKEGSFEDRNKLWQVMLYNISSHPILGCGFQAFWVIDSPTIILLYSVFVWLPVQAHNGYLDLINETGLIGLFIFILVIVKYLGRVIRTKTITPWIAFIILPLITNITESVLIRMGNINTVFFILTYLTLYIINNNSQDYFSNRISE